MRLVWPPGRVFHRLVNEPSVLGETPTLPTVLVGLFAGVATVAVSGLRFSTVFFAGPPKVTAALLLRRSARVQMAVYTSDIMKGALKP